jgi:hypothetical protein
MKSKMLSIVLILLTFLIVSCLQFSCNQTPAQKQDSTTVPKQMSNGELVARGQYIITAGGCNDCHSPKIFTAAGPVADTTRLLSGHPAATPLMPIDKKVLKPGNWILVGPDLTSFVGPFGISYSANLTPDSTTGIGAWTEDVFIKTLRSGKHLGQEGGRQILPPMPWYYVAQFKDEDLKSMFAYLKSLPPIKNQVPGPVSPDELAKMK